MVGGLHGAEAFHREYAVADRGHFPTRSRKRIVRRRCEPHRAVRRPPIEKPKAGIVQITKTLEGHDLDRADRLKKCHAPVLSDTDRRLQPLA